ncbi:50S ribosomal protein L25/general stress protein Ctc [Halomonas denitrificans]|uniref:50S ribosomal protein L25/general stress protein Ctc n=1 Tax=Halomonas TaxID=2745 RepID=UPI001C95C65B|nr:MULTISPECIES: 50S ribosomal protein L25/general stress protein Ctc [Halomonas]MBY5926165.1 50S ribosomal protein L25/general stress protein Ctc [Halomonas sp. DP4Y7-2]MBY5931197.1 50S ribosomal protein L25/general stress protein Ctc [Halomonas sp. DP8Y7-3]MBY5984725.1 50S ribosomal protein L25/general stress protein Ctc [Halomonas sp. DP5Y7-2]MBY6209348.1 50S ribosomal protein L25/general stress protein Ctc [Halomonas sp. DP3Y7-2]MBY6229503.1 50S ribosomal protein L25/general stress protein
MSDYKLTANVRNDLGKGASRRLRRANQQVPAIIYGGEKTPQPIAVDKTAFYKALEEEAFFSSVITLEVDGKAQQVVVRDLQRHPYKPLVTHADFLRVDATHEITMRVPLHVVGQDESKALKEQDGELHQLANDVEISCLPKDLPDYLEVDISGLELGSTLHLSDLKAPAGVTIVELTYGEDHDQAIVNVTKAKAMQSDEEAAEDEAAAADASADAAEEAKNEGEEGDKE